MVDLLLLENREVLELRVEEPLSRLDEVLVLLLGLVDEVEPCLLNLLVELEDLLVEGHVLVVLVLDKFHSGCSRVENRLGNPQVLGSGDDASCIVVLSGFHIESVSGLHVSVPTLRELEGLKLLLKIRDRRNFLSEFVQLRKGELIEVGRNHLIHGQRNGCHRDVSSSC